MTRVLPVVGLCIVLCGCATAPQEPYRTPVSEMTPQERCGEFFRLMNSGYSNYMTKMALYEKARNEGCMGQPQPQTVVVR
jgi:hypothetical protein